MPATRRRRSSSAEASRWISLAGAAAALEPTAPNGDAAKAAEHRRQPCRGPDRAGSCVDSTCRRYARVVLNFGAYAIISSVIVSVGLVFGHERARAVRRMGCRPGLRAPALAAVFQAAAVLTVCIWFVSSMMGVVGFAGAVAEVGVGRGGAWRWRRRLPWRTPLAAGFALSSLGARARSCLTGGQPARHAL
ncbi:MAG: hypothetical protein ACLU1W_07175 [Collinsella sp.]